MYRLPVWAWITMATMTGMLVTVILVFALSRKSEPGHLAPSETGAGRPEGAQTARRKIHFNFSPFLPQGISITDLRADGPFLVGRIRAGAATVEPDQIRVTLYDEKHIKLDEVVASHPPLSPGETAELTVLSYQLSRAASVSFDPR